MRNIRLVLPILALAACDTPLGTEIARDQARSSVDQVVNKRFPGADPTPVTDCVIDNASGSEIVNLASAAVTGITERTVETVLEIGTRPETVTCLVTNAGPVLAARLAAGA